MIIDLQLKFFFGMDATDLAFGCESGLDLGAAPISVQEIPEGPPARQGFQNLLFDLPELAPPTTNPRGRYLTYTPELALCLLAEAQDNCEAFSIGKLSAELGVTERHARRIVAELTADGLLFRHPDLRGTPTDAGWAKVRALENEFSRFGHFGHGVLPLLVNGYKVGPQFENVRDVIKGIRAVRQTLRIAGVTGRVGSEIVKARLNPQDSLEAIIMCLQEPARESVQGRIVALLRSRIERPAARENALRKYIGLQGSAADHAVTTSSRLQGDVAKHFLCSVRKRKQNWTGWKPSPGEIDLILIHCEKEHARAEQRQSQAPKANSKDDRMCARFEGVDELDLDRAYVGTEPIRMAA